MNAAMVAVRSVVMDMRCSVYLRPSPERQLYIDGKIAELVFYFRVADENIERFLAEPKIRQIEKALKSVNMSAKDIAAFLGDDFYRDRAWERDGDDNAE